jgi:GrpB-like predicted nucleotidyltransferase (UPF0157 family)/quercetin dioxygenase-like cupin family protein
MRPMQIHKFDDEHLVPITEGGSRFQIGPLTGEEARVRVSIIRVPPGGGIAHHRAASRQFLCIVSGDGWVSGGDGRRRAIKAGEGACWEGGEEHETGSDGGLSAICIEGEFEVLARPILREIEVVDYDPVWQDWFEALRAQIWPAVEDVALRIDHVGSTSVPGLAAKPVIDLDVVVASELEVRSAVERIEALGYRWLGELGVPGRQAFMRLTAGDLPSHHLSVVVEDNKAHLDHWLLRDILRSDSEARAAYAAAKRRAVEVAESDIDAYTEAKGTVVTELLARARSERGFEPDGDGGTEGDVWERVPTGKAP